MPALNSVLRLEEARRRLDLGDPRKALAALDGRFPPALRAERDFLAAEALRESGLFKKAAGLYQFVLAHRDAERSLRFTTGLRLAGIYRALGRAAEARSVLQKIKADSPKQGEGRESWELESALIDRAQGRWAQSLKKLSTLLRRSLRAGDRSKAGFILWAIGGALRFSGRLKASKKTYLDSLSSFRRGRDDEGAVYALLGLGGISRILGDAKASSSYYGRAAGLLKDSPDLFAKAYAHCGLANALRQLGRLEHAETHYRTSYKLYSSIDDKVDLAYVDWGLGKIAEQQGDLKAALSRFETALRAFDRFNEDRGAALSELSIAQVRHALGQTAQAEALFDRAVRRSRRAGLHAHLEIFT